MAEDRHKQDRFEPILKDEFAEFEERIGKLKAGENNPEKVEDLNKINKEYQSMSRRNSNNQNENVKLRGENEELERSHTRKNIVCGLGAAALLLLGGFGGYVAYNRGFNADEPHRGFGEVQTGSALRDGSDVRYRTNETEALLPNKDDLNKLLLKNGEASYDDLRRRLGGREATGSIGVDRKTTKKGEEIVTFNYLSLDGNYKGMSIDANRCLFPKSYNSGMTQNLSLEDYFKVRSDLSAKSELKSLRENAPLYARMEIELPNCFPTNSDITGYHTQVLEKGGWKE